ncbi:hypothetical protein OPT61_g7293 [Boeremia exigua]|uniref:Uncharacterized protein n=1 Tax=Boeremia exigua TaxID=749465 RepID=A0ACC2I2V3_9PLEO|nr:hypothetical protein OPT61_g7293 [Boeremia exigua]
MSAVDSSAPLLTAKAANNNSKAAKNNSKADNAPHTKIPNPPIRKARRAPTDWKKARRLLLSGCAAPFTGLRRIWNRSWTVETCGLVLSVLALGGLVATLVVHQDKPQPEWPQLVTINSFVSLFSLLMRTGVGVVLAEGISQSRWQWYRTPRKLEDAERFDAASRGPWGSFLLLCNLRPRRAYYIAAVGALATIMAALTGFFLQQLVQFESCAQSTDAPGVLVAKTNNYTASGTFAGMRETYDQYSPMVAAATVGLIQPLEDFTNLLAHGCDSGNCTFPSTNGASFSTLAISHLCEDITPLLQRCNSTSFVGPPNDLITRLNANTSVELNLARLDVLATSTTATKYGNDDLFPLQTLTLGIGVSQFVHRMTTNHTIRNGVEESCAGSQQPSPGLIKFYKVTSDFTQPEDLYRNRTSVLWYYPPDCMWSLGRGATRGIQSYFESIFSDQKLSFLFSPVPILQGNMYLRALWQPDNRPFRLMNDLLEGSISFESADHALANMTKAMTVYMRTHGEEGPAGYARGQLWTTTTCVYVRWEWITFPAVMITLTSVFLLLVVIDNWGTDSERLWKSSVLATLFCEVDVHRDQDLGKEQLSAIAKSTSVSIGSKQESLRLIAR